MKKSEVSPERWARYLAYCKEYGANHREKISAKKREHFAKPEVKARKKAYDQRPDVIARRKEQKKNWKCSTLSTKERMTEEAWARRLETQRIKRSGFDKNIIAKLIVIQGGVCPICRREFGDNVIPNGDHCHDTKAPRGVLCHRCNIVEGKLKAIGAPLEEVFQRFHDYLTNPPFEKLSSSDESLRID